MTVRLGLDCRSSPDMLPVGVTFYGGDPCPRGGRVILLFQSLAALPVHSGDLQQNIFDCTGRISLLDKSSGKRRFAVYKKILVPLDGSELAECALPHVKNLMKSSCAEEVTILKVLGAYFMPAEYVEIGPSYLLIMEKHRDEARKYLADIEQRLDAEGIKVQTELLENERPADAISDYAAKNGIDMIIIATHGYTGLKKMMLGSVALELLHDSHVPVLLIRPESCRIQ